MKNIFDIQKALVKRDIVTALHYSKDNDQFYLDLNTGAKSHLYLLEDFTLWGRYDYKDKLDIQDWSTEESILQDLCFHFTKCLHGRTFYNSAWGDLCAEFKIKLPKLWI